MKRRGLTPAGIRTADDLGKLPLLEKNLLQKDPEYFLSWARRWSLEFQHDSPAAAQELDFLRTPMSACGRDTFLQDRRERNERRRLAGLSAILDARTRGRSNSRPRRILRARDRSDRDDRPAAGPAASGTSGRVRQWEDR